MDDQLLISDYLAGELNSEASAALESRVEKDADFAALLATQKAQHLVLQANARAEAKKEIQEQYLRFKVEQTPFRKIRPLWMYGVAAAAVLLIGFFLLNPWQTDSPQQLALAYMEPYPMDMARGTETQDQALLAYESGEYATALAWFEGVSASDQSPKTLLYLGECYSQLEQYDKATTTFAKIPSTAVVYDAALWRQALALVLDDRSNEAKKILIQISQSQHYKQAEASKLLESMEEM